VLRESKREIIWLVPYVRSGCAGTVQSRKLKALTASECDWTGVQTAGC
jgi:hypothetical protein